MSEKKMVTGYVMGKQEFLDKLRLALNGRVDSEKVADTLKYYEDYISAEVRMGRSEEDVMGALGDPRLIARTIIETDGGQAVDTAGRQRDTDEVQDRIHTVPGWVWLVVLIVVAVLILSVVFKVLSFFMPVIIIILLVSFLVKFFRDWLN